MPVLTLRRYTNVMAVADMLINRHVLLTSPETWSDANDRWGLEIYRDQMGHSCLRAMCLAGAGETFHHWQVFANGGTGACVVFKKKAFAALFDDHPLFRIGDVEYLTLASMRALKNDDDPHRLPFLKRWGFRHEEEFRVIGFNPTATVKSIGVPFDLSIIQAVIFSPFAIRELADSTAKTLRKIPGCSHMKFGMSHLTNNQSWQTEVQRYAARHKTIYGKWEPIDMVSLTRDLESLGGLAKKETG